MNILISCSTSINIESKYFQLARDVSSYFADDEWNLVFGAASFGMLGVCHDVFSEKRREISSHTVSKYSEDLKNLNGNRKYTHDDTFIRTKFLYDEADLVLFLPGGTGTIAEFFAILEENRTTKKQKKVILFNYEGFYDGVIDLIKAMVDKKFNDSSIFDFFAIVKTLDELILEIKELKNN